MDVAMVLDSVPEWAISTPTAAAWLPGSFVMYMQPFPVCLCPCPRRSKGKRRRSHSARGTQHGALARLPILGIASVAALWQHLCRSTPLYLAMIRKREARRARRGQKHHSWAQSEPAMTHRALCFRESVRMEAAASSWRATRGVSLRGRDSAGHETRIGCRRRSGSSRCCTSRHRAPLSMSAQSETRCHWSTQRPR